MHGLMALVDLTHPEWLLLENTDELAENPVHRPDLDLFMHDLSSRGYEIKVFVLESSDFILPQARESVFSRGRVASRPQVCHRRLSGIFQSVRSIDREGEVVRS